MERTTLKRAAEALRDMGLKVRVQPAPVQAKNRKLRPDARVEVRFGGHRVAYVAEVKRFLRPATIGAALHQLAQYGDRPLLVADHVTPPLAETLRAQGVAFVDTAGNAHLEDPPLFVWVTGRRPPEGARPRVEGRAFQVSGLRVLFALLCRPKIVELPYREIAQYAGVAHGTVGWVMAELPKLGYVAEYRKRRLLVRPERLLIQWAEAYARTLRPKLLLGRFQAADIGWWRKFDHAKYRYLLGGEPAGARMTDYLKPGRVTLYGDRVEPKFLARFGLRPDDAGNVEILERFWHFNEDRAGLVPAPLVYADLLATGETRCLETAEMIHERILDGFERLQ